MSIDLSTTYLQEKLRSPLVVSANPLTENLDNLKRMEDAGAGAIVLYSLFEEQLIQEQFALHHNLNTWSDNHPEADRYFPRIVEFHTTSDAYLEHIRKAKQSIGVPIIGSLNGSSIGGWTSFAARIEEAGADGLELNLYHIPTDPMVSAAEVEQGYLDTVMMVRNSVKIPVAVKLSPFFTSMAHMAKRIDEIGVNSLVLFNRFYQPDIDIETRDVYSHVVLSKSEELRLPMRWIALLYGHIKADLAATSGIHHGEDVLKAIMAGATVTMMASALLERGISYIRSVEFEIREWMEQHEYISIDEMRGSVSQLHSDNPATFERAQYMKALTTYMSLQYGASKRR